MNKFDIAWNNAPELYEENPGQFRVCYLCKRIMNHGTQLTTGSEETDGWNIDHIDGNHKNNLENNLVAVHYECNVKKGNRNKTNLFKRVSAQEWERK